jgi:hypothetical protein
MRDLIRRDKEQQQLRREKSLLAALDSGSIRISSNKLASAVRELAHVGGGALRGGELVVVGIVDEIDADSAEEELHALLGEGRERKKAAPSQPLFLGRIFLGYL